LLMAMIIVNAVSAAMLSKFFGNSNLLEGMLSTLGILPIGVGLQDPVVICLPPVRGRSNLAQSLMKLLFDVADGTWSATGGS
jgi:hypothetical protein